MVKTPHNLAVERRGGQALAEYVLILAFASIAVVAALGVYGSALADAFDHIVQQVNSL
jgi:Flp pilus assembly pilin Flp